MTNRIEQLIDEIEDYIDSCRYQPLSNTKIIVEKDKIDELIRDLKSKTPEELAQYQKVVSNQQRILNDAKEKAEKLISEAAQQTHEMISQNAIMKEAYAQADEVVKTAYQQAQDILAEAKAEADAYRNAAVEYMDNMLSSYEQLTAQAMKLSQSHYESFYSQMTQYHEIAVSNRLELLPPSIDTSEIPQEYFENMEEDIQNTDNIPSSVVNQNTGNITGTGSIPQATVNAATGQNTGDIKLDLM
ncbi:MAG: vacuolar family H+-ATPase subunit H [Lachnospiraceae bacterium]|nr:vacuolar family H+-ATPase subunit H [Lachnospiraceae bacterium]